MKKPLVRKKNRLSRSLFEIEAARQRVLTVIFLSPNEEFSLTDLAKTAGVSKSSASRVAWELEQEGVVKIIERPILLRIKANRGSAPYLKEKIAFNLSVIYRSGLVEALVERFNNPKAIVLFGSFRWGDDIAGSDVDIAIESGEPSEPEIVRVDELRQLEGQIGREIRILIFNRDKCDLNVFNNIANGIVLAGFLEVRS
jgi:predicted nucleotidyltransferase